LELGINKRTLDNSSDVQRYLSKQIGEGSNRE